MNQIHSRLLVVVTVKVFLRVMPAPTILGLTSHQTSPKNSDISNRCRIWLPDQHHAYGRQTGTFLKTSLSVNGAQGTTHFAQECFPFFVPSFPSWSKI